jgi:hypothetical protein
MSFCNKDTTWCCNGEPGPPGSSDTSYVIGLGIYLFSFSQEGMGPPDYGYSFGSEIVYFNKNGIECGTQVTVGIKEPSCFNHGLTIYPNPATNVIIISSEQAAAIEITNIQGQLVKTISATGNKTNIDVSALPSGVYAVEVKTEKGVEVKKFIKE